MWSAPDTEAMGESMQGVTWLRICTHLDAGSRDMALRSRNDREEGSEYGFLLKFFLQSFAHLP